MKDISELLSEIEGLTTKLNQQAALLEGFVRQLNASSAVLSYRLRDIYGAASREVH